MTRLTAHALARAGDWSGPADSVTLDYRARLLRRRVIETAAGASLLVDLPSTTSCNHGDAFVTEGGGHVVVIAAQEPLLEVSGALHRLAWHIGNRHAPCQIEADRLLIQRDKVLRAMLEGLGACLRDVTAPFLPEGGAYGHGRTMGHTHGTGADDAGHGHHAPDARAGDGQGDNGQGDNGQGDNGQGHVHGAGHGAGDKHGAGDGHGKAPADGDAQRQGDGHGDGQGHGKADGHDNGHTHDHAHDLAHDHAHAHTHVRGDAHGDHSHTDGYEQAAQSHDHPHRHAATQGAGRGAQATDGHGH